MASKRRVVVDTNLWISYLIKSNSRSGKIVGRILRNHTVLFSEATLLELAEKISSPRLRPYFTESEGTHLVLLLEQVGDFIDVTCVVDDCRDPDDNKFLALALDAEADCIVTGDKDLQELNPYRGIDVIAPAEFVV